jgi:hypothetical protein
MITLYIARKQNDVANRNTELSRRIASKQIVAPMRQAWINDLRDKLSELSSSALHYWNTGYEDRNDEEYKRLGLLEAEILFRINPHEIDHQDLLSAIRKMLFALQRGAEDAGNSSDHISKSLCLGRKSSRPNGIELKTISTGLESVEPKR